MSFFKRLFGGKPKARREPKQRNREKNHILEELRKHYKDGVVDGDGKKILIVGKSRFGKTTLAKRLVNPEHSFYCETFRLNEAVTDKETLIFDDVNSEQVAEWQKDIVFEYLTNHAHYNIRNVFLIAQHLKLVPRHLLDLVDFIIFFNSPKAVMKLAPHFEGLRQANTLLNEVLTLAKYECLVFDFRNNTISEKWTNQTLPIRELMEKPLEGTPFQDFLEPKPKVKATRVGYGMKKTYLVGCFALMNRHVRYRAIGEMFGVSKSYVCQSAYRIQHGVIKLTQDQIEHIAKVAENRIQN